MKTIEQWIDEASSNHAYGHDTMAVRLESRYSLAEIADSILHALDWSGSYLRLDLDNGDVVYIDTTWLADSVYHDGREYASMSSLAQALAAAIQRIYF